MTVLGIDPGPVESAWVLWDGLRLLEFGKEANNLLVENLWGRDCFSVLVIEMVASYGMPVGREVFETCVWIGRYMQAYHGFPQQRMTRGDVKMHLCHSMKAKDSNIRQALIDRFGAPGTKKNPGLTYGLSGDTWAAFALAVCWWDKYGAGVCERVG